MKNPTSPAAKARFLWLLIAALLLPLAASLSRNSERGQRTEMRGLELESAADAFSLQR